MFHSCLKYSEIRTWLSLKLHNIINGYVRMYCVEFQSFLITVKPEFLKKLVDTAVDSGELINLEAEVRPSESVT